MSDEAALKQPEAPEQAPAVAVPAQKVWTEAEQARIVDLLGKYTLALRMRDYEIDISFSEEPCKESDGTSAWTYANYPYRISNKIEFFPRMLSCSHAQQEVRVVHELVHILVDPLYGLLHKVLVKEMHVTWRESKDINEFVTDQLATILYKLVEPEKAG